MHSLFPETIVLLFCEEYWILNQSSTLNIRVWGAGRAERRRKKLLERLRNKADMNI
jgi:hypothetical protein